jgi:hypothetical protein
MGRMAGIVALVHLPSDDLAAVQIEDQVQVKPLTGDLGG